MIKFSTFRLYDVVSSACIYNLNIAITLDGDQINSKRLIKMLILFFSFELPLF